MFLVLLCWCKLCGFSTLIFFHCKTIPSQFFLFTVHLLVETFWGSGWKAPLSNFLQLLHAIKYRNQSPPPGKAAAVIDDVWSELTRRNHWTIRLLAPDKTSIMAGPRRQIVIEQILDYGLRGRVEATPRTPSGATNRYVGDASHGTSSRCRQIRILIKVGERYQRGWTDERAGGRRVIERGPSSRYVSVFPNVLRHRNL